MEDCVPYLRRMKRVILLCLVWTMAFLARTDALPAGIITGRVFDSTGKPMRNAVVGLLHVLHTRKGRSVDVVDARATNRRGEYRFDAVPPGEYYLGAAPSDTMTHVTTLYPSAPHFHSATKIVIKAGEQLRDMDIQTRNLKLP